MSSNAIFKQLKEGLTLVELMLALLISSIVMASFMLVSKGFNSVSTDLQQDMRSQLGIRSFIELLNLHASQSGYQPADTSFATGIKTLNPFYLNGTATNPGVLSDVATLQFIFDSSTTTRDYALYGVQTNVRKGRTEKKVVLTHYYKNTSNATVAILGSASPMVTVDVLLGVKDFKCSFRAILGTPRALDCYLSVYKDFAPSTATLDYEFTLATTQSF